MLEFMFDPGMKNRRFKIFVFFNAIFIFLIFSVNYTIGSHESFNEWVQIIEDVNYDFVRGQPNFIYDDQSVLDYKLKALNIIKHWLVSAFVFFNFVFLCYLIVFYAKK